jgi:hypothetical protein
MAERDQAPTHQHNPARAIGNDHGHHLPGGDVIACGQDIEIVADLESRVEGFSRLKREAPHIRSRRGDELTAYVKPSQPPQTYGARRMSIAGEVQASIPVIVNALP